MSGRVEEDSDGMYVAFVDGEPVEGEPGRPLRFETSDEAQDLLERRAELFSLPVRPLRECR